MSVDPEELEQLARSPAMAPVLGERDRQAVIEALRRLAEVERAKRRHPSGPLGADFLAGLGAGAACLDQSPEQLAD